MRALRAASGVRLGLPAFTWMLEIGALFMQTETELVLKSRRVVPSIARQWLRVPLSPLARGRCRLDGSRKETPRISTRRSLRSQKQAGDTGRQAASPPDILNCMLSVYSVLKSFSMRSIASRTP
jgi:hypothetical protein